MAGPGPPGSTVHGGAPVATALTGISGKPGDERVRPTTELRRRDGPRPSFVLVGVMLIVGAALAGALIVRSSSSTVPALILAQDLRPGQTLTASHLTVAEIGTAPGLSWVGPADQDRIVGAAAAGPLVAGQLVTADMFSSRSASIGAGNVIVAAALRAGDAPVSVLPGDRVSLQWTGPVTGPSFDDPAGVTASRPIGEARIWSVASSGAGDMVLSLLVEASLETVVSQSAAAGSLKVNIVGGDR